MTKYDLQMFAGLIVTESKLPKQAKLQMLEWLQNEASKVDIMGFLMDGRIQHFDENIEKVVIDRFMVHEALKRIPTKDIKGKMKLAKEKCSKVKDRKKRSECIFKFMKK